MKKYELMYIIPSQYTEGEMDEIVKKVAGILESAGAKISDTHNLGKRRLAYAIGNQRNGTYILVILEAEPDAIIKVNQVLRLTNEVLRHMIVEWDPHQKPVMMFTDTEERRTEEQREHYAAATAPIQMKPADSSKAPGVDIDELDKRLDEILTEEVL